MAYNKLQKSSMLLATALLRRTMTQILVKLALRQRELGINAGRLRFTWNAIQQINAGIETPLRTSSEILVACLMLLMFEDNILLLSVCHSKCQISWVAYARTYDRVASPVLSRSVPIQSTSESSWFTIIRGDLWRESRGRTQKPNINDTAVVAPAR